MAVQRLAVLDGASQVGTLTRVRGEITFTYADDWRSSPGATPLSVSMPLTDTVHPHDRISPWLWGLLPDNDRVLSRWGRMFHTTTAHPLGLLASVGRDLPGCFQIVPESDVDVSVPSGVEWLSDDDVAQLLRELTADQTAWLGSRGAAGRWSLAGAQAKIALRRDGGRWGRPFGRAATTHILKPAVTGRDEHDLNEHLCLGAARGAGLLAARSQVITVAEERAICVARYDRVATDDLVVRIHQEDLCQALGVHPDRKYESDGGPSAASIASVLTRSIGGDAGLSARERFADALALNWLLAGPDAHAKNYSLLLSGGQVRLAPLYDVASALPYPDFYADRFRLAMRTGGQYLAARVTADHWRRVAAQLGLEEDAVLVRVAALAERLPGAIADAAAQPDVVALDSALPHRLLDLVTQRCATLGGRLG